MSAPSKRGPGRPALPEAERRERSAERERAKTAKKRSGKLIRTLWMTEPQAARLEALLKRDPHPSASDLVAVLVRRAPEPANEPATPHESV